MLGWWFWQAYSENPNNWFNIFSQSTVGTVLFQWAVAIAVFIFFNKAITQKMLNNNEP